MRRCAAVVTSQLRTDEPSDALTTAKHTVVLQLDACCKLGLDAASTAGAGDTPEDLLPGASKRGQNSPAPALRRLKRLKSAAASAGADSQALILVGRTSRK